MVTAISRLATASVPVLVAFEQTYPGKTDQVSAVRTDLELAGAGCPAAENLVLLASELATNAVLHSGSGQLSGEFTVRLVLYVGDYAWAEVIDQGGQWDTDECDDEHGRGLAIVAAVAGEGNWGIDGGTACRIAWFRLPWNQHEPAPAAAARGGDPLTDRTQTFGPHRLASAAVAAPDEDWDSEFMRLAYCVGRRSRKIPERPHITGACCALLRQLLPLASASPAGSWIPPAKHAPVLDEGS